VGIAERIKPHFAGLKAYEPGKPIEELERELGIEGSIKLASNENAIGPSPKAVAAMQRAAESAHRYPDGKNFALRRALAANLGVADDQLVFGAGSDEILELIAKALIGPGAEVVYPWPSFAMYPLVVQGMGGTAVPVPLTADMNHDLSAMSKAISDRTQVVFVCNPNNPTGTSIGRREFDHFIENLPEDLPLVIDEAYVEYARRDDFPNSLEWVRRRPATCVLRTFSKAYALAGARVGYGVTDAEFAGWLERGRHPFNVNLIAEAGALAALEDVEHLRRGIESNTRGLETLGQGLTKLGVRFWPSDANFLLMQTGEGTYEALLRLGVIVRPMAGFGMPDCVRVTVGTDEENARFLDALSVFLRKGAGSGAS
jgi:histidinol-phosphate aminotransferase